MGLVNLIRDLRLKDVVGISFLITLHFTCQYLFTDFLNDGTSIAFFPLIMAGVGVAQGIFGGMAQAAAAERQNKQAMQQWVAGNTQKTINNARSQFQAAQQWSNQLKRNEEITKNAYAYSFDARQAALAMRSFKQQQTSNVAMAQRASLLSSVTARGIAGSSGTSTALKNAQAMQLLNENKYQNMEYQNQVKAIQQQEKNMLSQQTENVFMPNIQGYDEQPILQDTSMPMIGGAIAGVAGGLQGALSGMEFIKEGGFGTLFGTKS